MSRKSNRQIQLFIVSIALCALAACILYIGVAVTGIEYAKDPQNLPTRVSEQYRPDLSKCPVDDAAYERPDDKLWECIRKAMYRSDI